MTNAELQAYEAVKGIHREMRKANEVNWEQRRYEIAKDCLVGILSNPNIKAGEIATPILISVSVQVAELLIHELRTKEDDKNEKKD